MSKIKLQDDQKICITKQKSNLKIIIIAVLVAILCFSSVSFAYNYFSPELKHNFEKTVEVGTPKVGEDTGYSTVKVSTGYEIKLCANPTIEGDNAYFYLTNPKSNDIWFKAEVIDENDEVIGSTDVIKQDQYVATIKMTEKIKKNTKVKLRIVSYKPHTWESCGNVNLKITLNPSETK